MKKQFHDLPEAKRVAVHVVMKGAEYMGTIRTAYKPSGRVYVEVVDVTQKPGTSAYRHMAHVDGSGYDKQGACLAHCWKTVFGVVIKDSGDWSNQLRKAGYTVITAL